jgi:hypothetical protein
VAAIVTPKPKPRTRSIRRGRGHSYELDREKVLGVTTVLRDGVPKGALIAWAAGEAADYAIDHWDDLAALPLSERQELIRKAPDRTRDKAGERGREVHELVRRYLAGETIAPPDELRGHVDAGLRFVDEWRVEELAVEFAVFARADPELGRRHAYGGRPDLLARLADGLDWLLDWKTALKGPFSDWALQLAAYRYADFYVVDGDLDDAGDFVEHAMPVVDRCGVVHLHGDGSYELVPLEADEAALEVFAAACEVARFTKGDRDEWIGDALRAPARADDELELDADRQAYFDHVDAREAAA